MKRTRPYILAFAAAVSSLALCACNAQKPVLVPKAEISLVSGNEDHAGPWGVFSPGMGRGNRSKSDWGWKLALYLPEKKGIRSITVMHNYPGEGWSTSSDKLYNKNLYPLVVLYQDRQLNTAYDQPLGEYGPGNIELRLFGQMENTPFIGGKLFLTFTDGLSLIADIPEAEMSEDEYGQCEYEANFDPGRVWYVQEGVWHGKWVRRPESNVFDAQWGQGGQLGESRDVIELREIRGRKVTLFRRGTNGYYHGILSCDKKQVLDGRGDWFANNDRWSARITDEDNSEQSVQGYTPEGTSQEPQGREYQGKL